jgi:hypothetical protein
MVGLVETMMTADSLQLTAYGPLTRRHNKLLPGRVGGGRWAFRALTD